MSKSAAFVSWRAAAAIAVVALGAVALAPAHAGDTEYDATIKDIQDTLGTTPHFMSQMSKAGLPGAWAEVKAVEFSNDTALPAKVKALISLAVSAQIPCQYCVWQDTETAKAAGATQEEIAEAVEIAALARHWSTVFNGLQVDFEQFKKDMSGNTTN
jgi:AhpD family alkylhydroperoxidase